jgi:hypothetical protein
MRFLPTGEGFCRASTAVAAFALLSTSAFADEAPPGLSCLSRWYAVRAERADGGGWMAVLADGRAFPYDDGKAKTFRQKLDAPDLKDMFAVPYRRGPIKPVEAVDDDPGRVRFEPLFDATYGAAPERIDLVTVELAGQRVPIHRRAAKALERASARLRGALTLDPGLAPYFEKIGGTFVWRKIAGTDRRSPHSWGIAVDISVPRSDYWEWAHPREPIRWRNRIPQTIVDAFEAEGFIWAGRWYHYDTMHFEYRPELLDPACISR